jgi:CRISPR-associated protein Csm4
MRLYKSTITLRSASATLWHADTVFGHLCWSLSRLQGETALAEFLEWYEQGLPPILLSDGFPSDFLQRPLLPLVGPTTQMSKAERIEHHRIGKQAAQTDWLTLDEFNRARRGEMFSPSLSEQTVESVMGLNVTPKNQIDRLTDTAGGEAGELYDMQEFVIPRVTIYWRIEDGYLDLVRAFLDDLKETGYGKRKSIGYGQIEKVTLEESHDFTDTPDANGFVSLSRFVPSPRDPSDGYWSIAVKYGKLGEEFAVSGNPFKRPLVQLTCGSCFRDDVKSNWIQRWYGQLISELSRRPEVKQYAFAFLVPMRLPDRS